MLKVGSVHLSQCSALALVGMRVRKLRKFVNVEPSRYAVVFTSIALSSANGYWLLYMYDREGNFRASCSWYRPMINLSSCATWGSLTYYSDSVGQPVVGKDKAD